MQKLTAARLRPGMYAAQNVYCADGSPLIVDGCLLDETLIRRIQEWGLGSLAIAHPLFCKAIPPLLLPEADRIRAIGIIREVYDQFKTTARFDIAPLVALSQELTALVREQPDKMIHWGDLRTFDDYVYAHSVNVCVLSLVVGLQRQLSDTQLHDLALGALVHDLGLTKVSPEIMNKSGKLTTEEILISRRHTEFAYETLTENDPATFATIAQIALQHHENVDGSGYPRGTAAGELPELSRIVAVANMYDALVTERPFRKAFLPHEACELLSTLSNRYLDPDLLDLFLSHVATYPVGSVVRINTGEIGIVVAVPLRKANKPLLDIITDDKGHLLESPQPLDLAQQKKSFINKPLTEEEVLTLLATTSKQ